MTRGDGAGWSSFAVPFQRWILCQISETDTLVRSFGPSTWWYIWHDFGTRTSKFHPAAGFNLMRNIIPKGFWAQNTPGRSRSAAFLIRALWFSLSLLVTWWKSNCGGTHWKPAFSREKDESQWFPLPAAVGGGRTWGFRRLNFRFFGANVDQFRF